MKRKMIDQMISPPDFWATVNKNKREGSKGRIEGKCTMMMMMMDILLMMLIQKLILMMNK